MDIWYKEIIWGIAVFLSIPASYYYIRSILRWETKPHIYSRIIWAALMWIWFIIQVGAGWWPWAWMLWMATSIEMVIILLSIKYWTKDITKFDTFLLIWVLICIPIYIWIDDKLTHYY